MSVRAWSLRHRNTSPLASGDGKATVPHWFTNYCVDNLGGFTGRRGLLYERLCDVAAAPDVPVSELFDPGWPLAK